MNNLTTRKIVLGLLMTLVLAFGVQGVVEAITNPNTGDVANFTEVNSGVFDVGVSASISSINLVPDEVGTKETVRIIKSSGITLTGNFYGLSSVTLTEDEATVPQMIPTRTGMALPIPVMVGLSLPWVRLQVRSA